MKKLIIILFIAHCSLQIAEAQQPTLEWVARYSDGPENSNQAHCMAVDSSGNVFIAGQDNLLPYGFSIIKYSPSGQFLWRSRFSGGQPIMAGPVELTVDLQGNLYVAASDNRFIIIKFSPNGVQQWLKIHEGGGNTRIDGIHLIDNDKLIVGGSTPISIGSQYRPGIRIMNLNPSSGDSVWSRSFVFPTTTYYTFGGALDRTNITGDRNLIPPPYQSIFTISYDINGNLKWWRTFNDTAAANRSNFGLDIVTDRHGNVYSTGLLTYIDNRSNVATLKYDTLGNLKWVRIFNGYGYTYGYPISIKTDPWDNVIIGNRASSPADGDYIVQKYDPEGNLLWWRAYNGPADMAEYLLSMAIDKYGSIYLTGTSDDQQFPPIYSTATVKFDKDGNLKWVHRYYPSFPPDTTVNPGPDAGVIVDQNLNVYVAGTIRRLYNGSGFVDAIVLKYSQPIGIEPISSEIPGRFSLEQNYPNPFNPVTKIKFYVPKSSFVKLIIYDLLGREVGKVVNQQLVAGVYETEFNAQGLSSGVYFYKFEARDDKSSQILYSKTRKMLVVK